MLTSAKATVAASLPSTSSRLQVRTLRATTGTPTATTTVTAIKLVVTGALSSILWRLTSGRSKLLLTLVTLPQVSDFTVTATKVVTAGSTTSTSSTTAPTDPVPTLESIPFKSSMSPLSGIQMDHSLLPWAKMVTKNLWLVTAPKRWSVTFLMVWLSQSAAGQPLTTGSGKIAAKPVIAPPSSSLSKTSTSSLVATSLFHPPLATTSTVTNVAANGLMIAMAHATAIGAGPLTRTGLVPTPNADANTEGILPCQSLY